MLDSYNVAIPEKARQLLMHTGKSHQENGNNSGYSLICIIYIQDNIAYESNVMHG